MKRTNKIILAVLCIVLMLASFLLIVTACNGKGYSVTTQHNSEQGSVTVSLPAKGKLYADGEQVTVTVTPKSDFDVASFSVSGHSDAVLDSDGKYTFAISADTTVTVTFVDTRVNVTVNAGDGAHVTLNPQPQEGKLKKNTSVTVTVSLDEGYVLDKVIVGKEVQLTNNSYTFTVTDDVTIEVTTIPTPLNKALLALQGNVKLEGSMSVSYDDKEFNSTLITIYDVTRSAVWQRELSEGYTADVVWGKCANGMAGFYIHDYTNGHVQLVQYEDYYGNYVPFKQFENVFDRLRLSDFTSVRENVWTVTDSDNAQAILFSVTGYEFDVGSMLITLTEDGVKLYISSKEDSINFVFDLTATKDGTTIPAETFQDYQASNALASALAEATKATSYTASYSKKDLLEDSVSGYNVYVSNGKMWIDNPDDAFGYLTRPDGKIWEFFVDQDYMWLGDDPFANSILEVSSDFNLAGISPSMFVLNDNGQYVLRDIDLYFYSSMGVNLASVAAQAISNGEQQFYDAVDAQTFAITLKDGKLYSIEYYCESVDGSSSHVDTQIFSNFNATQIPVYIDEDLVKGIINPDYVGRWTDDEETFEIEITLEGAKIDYDYVYEIVAIVDGGYIFSCYSGDYTLVRQGDKLIVTDPSGKVYEMHAKLSDWDNLLGTFSFVAYLGGERYLSIGAEIGADSVVVYMGSSVMRSWWCYISGRTLNVYTDAYIFYIEQADVYGNAVYISYMSDSGTDVGFILYREGVEVDLSEFQGMFFANLNVLKIDGNSISVWLDGVTGENVATDIHVNYYMQSNGEPFAEICFRIEGFVFYLQVLSNDKIVMFDLLDDWGEFLFVRQGYVVDYSNFYGGYSAIDDASNTISIEEGKVTLVINGTTHEFTDIIFYDVEYGLPVFVLYDENGELFVLEQYGYILGYFVCYDEWHDIEIVFVMDGFVPDTSLIDGNYYGYDDDSKYTVEIADGTLKVYLDGVEQTVSQIVYNMYDYVDRSGTFYKLSFVMNGESYFVQPAYEMDGRIVALYFAKADAEESLFWLYLDQSEELYDWSDYVGVYEGEGYRVVIDSDSISITYNGVTLDKGELHYFSDFDYDIMETYYEFRFVFNGVNYTMQPADKGNCMMLIPNDGDAIYLFVNANYELNKDYKLFSGYYESDSGEQDKSYIVDIGEDSVTIYIDGKLCETEVLYNGKEGGMLIRIDGKVYHIAYVGLDEDWNKILMLYDNEGVRVMLTSASRPNQSDGK